MLPFGVGMNAEDAIEIGVHFGGGGDVPFPSLGRRGKTEAVKVVPFLDDSILVVAVLGDCIGDEGGAAREPMEVVEVCRQRSWA